MGNENTGQALTLNQMAQQMFSAAGSDMPIFIITGNDGWAVPVMEFYAAKLQAALSATPTAEEVAYLNDVAAYLTNTRAYQVVNGITAPHQADNVVITGTAAEPDPAKLNSTNADDAKPVTGDGTTQTIAAGVVAPVVKSTIIGMPVIYFPNGADSTLVVTGRDYSASPLPGIITGVIDENTVNIQVLRDGIEGLHFVHDVPKRTTEPTSQPFWLDSATFIEEVHVQA